MTRSFPDQRTSAVTGNFFLGDDAETLPLPIIDPSDGYGTCLKFAEVAETLVNEAEEKGITPESDGAYLLGDVNGDYIVIEQEVAPIDGSNSAAVINRISVTAPSKNASFRLRSQVAGDGSLASFRVDEEIRIAASVTTSHGEFTGTSGSELPAAAVKPTVHFAQTVLAVADTLYKEKEIGPEAREEVVEHLAKPDATLPEQPTRVMGSAALGRLLTNFRMYRAA